MAPHTRFLTVPKYWLSTLPEDIGFERMVELAKLGWRIERDYQELKQEVGLGHFEGRGWRGFHHHAGLRLPDLRTADNSPLRTAFRRWRPSVCLPGRPRPGRPAAAHRASHPQLHRHPTPKANRGDRSAPPAMSLLRSALQT